MQVLHRPDHVAQFPDAGGLDENPVRMELPQHLLKGLPEIPHQAAADAAGVHLRDLDPRILQKAAVDGDLAKLVFNEHQLLSLKSLLDQFSDQRRLPCPQESGKNIYFRHMKRFLSPKIFCLFHIILQVKSKFKAGSGI